MVLSANLVFSTFLPSENNFFNASLVIVIGLSETNSISEILCFLNGTLLKPDIINLSTTPPSNFVVGPARVLATNLSTSIYGSVPTTSFGVILPLLKTFISANLDPFGILTRLYSIALFLPRLSKRYDC